MITMNDLACRFSLTDDETLSFKNSIVAHCNDHSNFKGLKSLFWLSEKDKAINLLMSKLSDKHRGKEAARALIKRCILYERSHSAGARVSDRIERQTSEDVFEMYERIQTQIIEAVLKEYDNRSLSPPPRAEIRVATARPD